MKPNLVLDFTPVFKLLDEFESLIQTHASYEPLVAHLLEHHFRGEPVALGADPLSEALNWALPSPCEHAEIRQERLHLFWVKNDALLPLCTADLIDSHPGIVGFLYCLEDLRYLELSPPWAR